MARLGRPRSSVLLPKARGVQLPLLPDETARLDDLCARLPGMTRSMALRACFRVALPLLEQDPSRFFAVLPARPGLPRVAEPTTPEPTASHVAQ